MRCLNLRLLAVLLAAIPSVHQSAAQVPEDFLTLEEQRAYPWQVPEPSFDVFYSMPAAVKIVPTKFVNNGGACSDSGRGAMGINRPLKDIIQVAYQKDNLRTVVTADLPAATYDYFAKLIGPSMPHEILPTDGRWAIALQQEIGRQFSITGRLERRQKDVLLLKPSQSGVHGFKISDTIPKGKDGNIKTGDYSPDGNQLFYAQPLRTLVWKLEDEFQIPIVNQTGLTDSYDFALKFSQSGDKQAKLKETKIALLDQLGLELVHSREPIEILVVDKIR